MSFCVVQMAVCMTASLTGMNDNGHSNHSPREAEGETVGVCVCVSGERVGAPGPRQSAPPHSKPPTVVPCTKTRVYIKDTQTHAQIDKTELAWSRFEPHIMVVGTKEE